MGSMVVVGVAVAMAAVVLGWGRWRRYPAHAEA